MTKKETIEEIFNYISERIPVFKEIAVLKEELIYCRKPKLEEILKKLKGEPVEETPEEPEEESTEEKQEETTE